MKKQKKQINTKKVTKARKLYKSDDKLLTLCEISKIITHERKILKKQNNRGCPKKIQALCLDFSFS